ncbi:MAG: DUF3883 domain-containing protein [Acidobacteriota bacterium]|nr:DUF3883 domain-containing protein [Acidobacteriota bacterium]
MPHPWSTAEIEATVAAYFEMLRLELAGVAFVKAEHNARLRRLLNERTKASVEYKLQNISAILVNHGQVYIRGYLPAQNFQRALEAAVLEWIEGSSDLAEAIERSPILNPAPPASHPAFAEILSLPPDPRRVARPSREPVAVKVDFVRLEAQNRVLGTNGEEFVYEIEQRRLQDEERRPDLARKVRWRSRDDGDGLGYDILSFERTGAERLIEVKTTGGGIYTQFALTRNELLCSRRHEERYHLYRLFEFGEAPRLYTLQGALDRTCTLKPTQFSASVGRPIISRSAGLPEK